jgi:hypothetical protein
MPIQLSVSERLTYSTVRIECQLSSGGISTGTGFFYACNVQPDGRHVPVVVTNKHVVEGALNASFYVHLADAEGNPIPNQRVRFVIDEIPEGLLLHPDRDVDLCVIPIGDLLFQVEQKDQKIFKADLERVMNYWV